MFRLTDWASAKNFGLSGPTQNGLVCEVVPSWRQRRFGRVPPLSACHGLIWPQVWGETWAASRGSRVGLANRGRLGVLGGVGVQLGWGWGWGGVGVGWGWGGVLFGPSL